jgi:hypothetical protein
MKKCMIEGCTNKAYYNPLTGKSNMLCSKHFNEIKKSNKETNQKTHIKGKLSGGDKDKNKKKIKPELEKKPEVFVLRGHTLTINYTGKTKHINVNRLTRPVKYNEDQEGTSGKTFHYIIDIKQGRDSIGNILFQSKSERDREFEKLQSLLSKL